MRQVLLGTSTALLLGAGVMAAPGVGAYNGTTCAGGHIAGPLYGNGGDELVCADGVGVPGFDGGALLVKVGGPARDLCVGTIGVPYPVAVYVVLDGDNNNAANLSGYAGVSNYESGTMPGCVGGGSGSGTNSGGAVGIDDFPGVSLPLPIACGFTSGQNFNNTGRDGCYLP